MRIFNLLLFTLSYTTAIAQSKPFTQQVSTVSLLSPGVGFEQPLSGKMTVKGRAALSFQWSYSYSDFLGSAFEFAPSPMAAAHLRYYYNIDQREKKGKRTALNSANFLSLLVKYAYSNKHYHYGSDGNYSYSLPLHSPDVGVVWGIQRNYKNRFSLDCSIGPSLYSPIAQQEFSLIADITFGIWLGAKEQR
nr:hypothetical protein [uncultured Lacibacter sp.]